MIDYGNSNLDYSGGYGMPDTRGVEQLKFLFDQDELDTEKLKNYLLGKIYDIKKKEYIDTGNKMINEYGANNIIVYSKLYLGKTINLSQYSSEEVDLAMLDYNEILRELFMDKHHLFGITLEEAKRLKRFLAGLVESNYRKAIQGRGMDLIKHTTRNEQIYKVQGVQDRPMQNDRDSFMPNIFNRKRRMPL